MTLFRLLCFGVVIHIIFLLSIFDIYFKSPIIAGVAPEPNTLIPIGKRVVLISADGLRLDSLFDSDPVTGKYVAEYIQNIIKNRGSWGVSQSRVPTESRPGHVAMLAGFYEDPSAVTRGWKENPVDFDSIFNRSHCSFAWGSPDILNIFFKGLKHQCAFMESYSNEQNFAGDTREYDNWVYDKLKEFMKFSKNSRALYEEGIFFFLHLLGQDTSGHTDKPHTEKYRQNLKNVDKLVEKIENLFYEFYGDDKTSFIFTSDHGMTDWGSHGAGDLEEINTPFVAWGAGIKKPSVPPKQININQADITPLLAILLGSPIPVNSIGVLPVFYLNMSKKQIAEATFLNAKQIVAQYLKVLQDTEDHILSFLYVPFNRLSAQDVSSSIWFINDAIKSEKYSEAIINSKDLIEFGLEGLNYYQNYHQKSLLLCISLSYLGWTFYLLLELFSMRHLIKNYKNPTLNLVLYLVMIVTVILITVQRLPISFYSYALLPEILWYFTIKKAFALQPAMSDIDKKKFILILASIMAGVEILVISFFHRWCLSLSMIIILLWSLSSISVKQNKYLMAWWLSSGCALAMFSLLPTVGGQPNPLLTACSGVALVLVSLGSFHYSGVGNFFIFLLRLTAIVVSIWNNYLVHSHFNENQQLLEINKSVSWFLLGLSCILLCLQARAEVFDKLHQVFMSLSIPFLLLSIKQEGFFLLFLFIHLFCWIYIESCTTYQNRIVSDFRIAYFFLAYIFLSFFGLGNISSLNSFDPAWVRCFLTVFSPFLMTALILFKTVIPFLVVTCTMRIMTVVLNIQTGRLFIIVLIYCNIMGLNFLFLVRNNGSWLDIGTSISHYVIQQVTIVFLVLLFGIAKFLTKHSYIAKEVQFKKFNAGLSRTLDQGFSLPTFYNYQKSHKL